MESLVSVIIPVYNADKYLNKCLDSVLSQSYKNIEVLLIDDGSTDKSGNICDEYAMRDDRIKVFHKENGGVSSARNLGLENFKGDYVCFVDADDYVESDYVKAMVTNIADFDCIAIGLQRIDKSSNESIEIICHSNAEYTSKELFVEQYCIDGVLRQVFFGPYCKLYKREVAEKNIFNEQMVSGEDIVFNLNCLSNSNRIKLLDFIGYYLVKHAHSATNTSSLRYSPRTEHDYTIITNNIADARRKLGVPEEWINRAQICAAPSRFVWEVVNLYCYNTPYTKKDALNKIREIHNDIPFIEKIRSNKWKDVTNLGKLALLCVWINNPVVTSILCRIIMIKHYKKSK